VEPAQRFSVPWAVHAMTRRPAETVGMLDRGLVARGLKADLNVIDFERLAAHAPEVRHDLPSGGRRMLQRADGYDATIVSGKVIYRDGQATGALPGRLVRGTGYRRGAAIS
jgi:N-acyl-D-aspartate/D-glutamate deacylase